MPDPIRQQSKRLQLLFSETDAVYHEATLKFGLTDSSMIVLYTICLFDGSCPLGDIAALSGLPKQTVNSALRRLEGDGVLYLEAAGGRKKRVCLTEKGHGLCRDTALRLMRLEDEIYASWPPEDLEKYLSLTQRFLSGLREKVQKL